MKSKFQFRVNFASRDSFRVMDEQHNIFSARLAGKLRHGSSVWPAVGDYITGSHQPGEWILIESVQSRASVLARKDPSGGVQILAANVDTLFVVTSANEDLNLNRLERYVGLALSGEVQPVIVVNKMELSVDPHELLDRVAARFPSLEILGVSAVEGWNIDALLSYVTVGQTVALLGSSGVGKSTLTNLLLGFDLAETQAIRQSDGRGRHTTTHRELHVLSSGAAVIDTPGLRQVALSDDVDIDGVFADIEALASQCRFSDCGHGNEPGCAVAEALNSGGLEPARWQSYLKLKKEIAYEQRKASKELQALEKKKWAKIHMAIRRRTR